MKKENLINKIVKKDFNNELEAILEKKDYEENVKSLLLNLLYKIETGYKDVETVKIDVDTKEECIKRLISIIYSQCKSIKIIKMNDNTSKIPQNGTYFIDKTKKEIECYPIERKLLYAIWKIGKKDNIITNEYYFINEVLSDLLNIGNTIDSVEPLRDFNGYSWTTVSSEIESIEHNIIYQNLRILVGNKLLNKWIYNKEIIIDYYEQFKERLTKLYGKEIKQEIIDILIKIAILLEMKFQDKKVLEYKKEKKRIETELKNTKDREKFVIKTTNKKLELANKIKEIDTILSDKKLLEQEYKIRNQKLPLDKKIFSMRVLANTMIKEREKLYEKIEEKNNLLNPKKLVEYNKQLKEKMIYLKILETEEIETELEKNLIKFQEIFLKCFQKKIKKAETKQDIINLIYEIRYYIQLPINREAKIYEVLDDKYLKPVILKLLNKAREEKIIQNFTKNEDIFYIIWKEILSLRAIKLEELSFKIVKNKDKYEVQIFDEDLFEEKKEQNNIKDINLKEAGLKLNKKQKLFE